MLPLPLGATVLQGLDVVSVRRNRLGTVEASGSPAVMRFEATYDERSAASASASEKDLAVLERDRDYLQRWLDAQGLAGQQGPGVSVQPIVIA